MMNRYVLAALVLLAAPILGAPASQQATVSTKQTTAPLATDWTICASENGTCSYSGNAEVRYGANGKYASKTMAGPAACTNGVFGDPIYGVAKSCWYRAVATSATATAAAQQTATSVGMNLSSPAYWSTAHPFIDRAKVGNWFIVDSAGWRDAPNLNTQGFPSSVPSGAQMVLTVGVDPIELATTDRYVLTYKGTISISGIGSGSIVSSAPGRVVFVATSTQPFIIINGISASDPLTEIHVVREDQVSAFNAGGIFNPPFLANAKRFTVLRMMDWAGTNGSPRVDFSDMPNSSDATWTRKGVPVDVQIALANQAGADLWVNIPAHATDDLVRRMLTQVRDKLSPSLRVHVEYSNEVWNWQFEQTSYAQRQGDLLWLPTRAQEFGTWGAANDPHIIGGNEMYYGYRSVQIARIAHDIFSGGNATRLSCLIAVQTAYQGLEDFIFKGMAVAGVTDPATLFEEYAVTTYFGDQLSGESAEDRAVVLRWARGGASGMTAAFQDIATGGALKNNSSLAEIGKYFDYHGAVAKKRGLKLVAYEGSLSANALNYSGQDRIDIVAFLQRLEDDPRMATLYTQMVSRFAAAGGKELTAFADVGSVSVYGTWGMIDSIYVQSTRNDALAAFNGR